MADLLHGRPWLLIDAAGPVSVIGLVHDYAWMASSRSEGDFLEWLEPAVRDLLSDKELDLESLSGVVYGAGPGSTLGLRLAALFIRTLMGIPSLDHWTCYQYHNLELAICASQQLENDSLIPAVAPWRRDRLHVSRWDDSTHSFKNGGISPDEAVTRQLTGYSLGRRHPGKFIDLPWTDYPIDRIPATLKLYPWLLHQAANPTPYAAEVPQFARWNPARHPAK